MDTKHIHCMLEKISEYGKCMMEEATGSGNVNLDDAGKIVDMVKDLACAEKDALIAKEMRKAHEDDEAEEKYIRKMLKEENKDEFKRYMEEYGDEGERRFYDDWRYASGRFAPKGRGSYEPRRSGRRRGYVEPEYRMPLEMYHNYTPEELRDMDRESRGVMYFSSPMGSGNMSGGRNSSGNSADSVNSNARGYEEYQRGYSEGRMEGYNQGRNAQNRDYREGKSGTSRRGYMESRENHKDNTPESKQANMKELEKYMKSLSEDLTEAIEGASNEEKTMLKSKLQTLVQKI